jgi:hypothetical protein
VAGAARAHSLLARHAARRRCRRRRRGRRRRRPPSSAQFSHRVECAREQRPGRRRAAVGVNAKLDARLVTESADAAVDGHGRIAGAVAAAPRNVYHLRTAIHHQQSAVVRTVRTPRARGWGFQERVSPEWDYEKTAARQVE